MRQKSPVYQQRQRSIIREKQRKCESTLLAIPNLVIKQIRVQRVVSATHPDPWKAAPSSKSTRLCERNRRSGSGRSMGLQQLPLFASAVQLPEAQKSEREQPCTEQGHGQQRRLFPASFHGINGYTCPHCLHGESA